LNTAEGGNNNDWRGSRRPVPFVEEICLAKEDLIEFEGTVQELLPDARPIATRHTLHDLAARETIRDPTGGARTR